MKTFTIIKTGYSVGVYGNTGEYFSMIYTNDNDGTMESLNFWGQYGSEDRVRWAMKEKGFEVQDILNPDYGQVKAREAKKWHTSEEKALEFIQSI